MQQTGIVEPSSDMELPTGSLMWHRSPHYCSILPLHSLRCPNPAQEAVMHQKTWRLENHQIKGGFRMLGHFLPFLLHTVNSAIELALEANWPERKGKKQREHGVGNGYSVYCRISSKLDYQLGERTIGKIPGRGLLLLVKKQLYFGTISFTKKPRKLLHPPCNFFCI